MANTAYELLWFKQLLVELGFASSEPLLMFCDNQATINIAFNPEFYKHTKHIEVDCPFLRQHVTGGDIPTPYLHSKDQLADMLTKAISRSQLDDVLSKMDLLNISHQLEGIVVEYGVISHFTFVFDF